MFKSIFSVKTLTILSFGLLFGVFFSFSPLVSASVEATKAASDPYGLVGASEGTNLPTTLPGTGNSIPGLIGKVVGIVLSFLGALFFALIVYGGLLWMTAHGNETQVKKAQTIMQQAIVGLIIVLAAYAFTSFIGSLL